MRDDEDSSQMENDGASCVSHSRREFLSFHSGGDNPIVVVVHSLVNLVVIGAPRGGSNIIMITTTTSSWCAEFVIYSSYHLAKGERSSDHSFIFLPRTKQEFIALMASAQNGHTILYKYIFARAEQLFSTVVDGNRSSSSFYNIMLRQTSQTT